MNAGLRFDQMWQYTDANQLSPRLSFTYKPFENTTFHAGYARYFTPPVLVEAAPANIALFNNTTGAPNAGQPANPVLPERSHYFDAGVVQKIPFGCYGGGVARLLQPRNRPRRLLQDRKRLDRQRPVRPGAGAQRLQLPAGHQRRRRAQPEIHTTAISRLTAISRWRSKRRPTWCRTNICSTIPRRTPISAG